MAENEELSEYTVTDSDGVARQYLLTAADAKARGAKSVNGKARTPANKAVTPENKTTKG